MLWIYIKKMFYDETKESANLNVICHHLKDCQCFCKYSGALEPTSNILFLGFLWSMSLYVDLDGNGMKNNGLSSSSDLKNISNNFNALWLRIFIFAFIFNKIHYIFLILNLQMFSLFLFFWKNTSQLFSVHKIVLLRFNIS